MVKVKKLIDKFRKWLIVKLGGFTTPCGEVKRYTLHPIVVRASFKQHQCDYDIPEEYIKERLVKLLVEEIIKNDLYRIETCVDYSQHCKIHEINIDVIDPKELQRNGKVY